MPSFCPATTFVPLREGPGKTLLHFVVSDRDPLVRWLNDRFVGDDGNPVWFVAAHEAAHVRFRDVENLSRLAVFCFAVGIGVAFLAGPWWGLAISLSLRPVMNWDFRRREKRADRLAMNLSKDRRSQNDVPCLAKSALIYFSSIKQSYLQYRREEPLGKAFVDRDGNCRLDFLHPPLCQRLKRALSSSGVRINHFCEISEGTFGGAQQPPSTR